MKKETATLLNAKRFYFIEYYALLLEAIDKFALVTQAQRDFIKQKNSNFLGLSRYRKISTNVEDGTLLKSKDQYEYTFSQVLLECKDFSLVAENKETKEFLLTDDGQKLLNAYKEDKVLYRKLLLKIMEKKYNAFQYLLNKFYNISPQKSGLIII